MAAERLESSDSDSDSDSRYETINNEIIFFLYNNLEVHLSVQSLTLYNELEFYCLLSPKCTSFNLQISKNRLNYC